MRIIVLDISSDEVDLDLFTLVIQGHERMQSHDYSKNSEVERGEKRSIRVINLSTVTFPNLEFKHFANRIVFSLNIPSLVNNAPLRALTLIPVLILIFLEAKRNIIIPLES